MDGQLGNVYIGSFFNPRQEAERWSNSEQVELGIGMEHRIINTHLFLANSTLFCQLFALYFKYESLVPSSPKVQTASVYFSVYKL